MKKAISLLMIIVVILLFALEVCAVDVTPCNNNVAYTNSVFTISDGVAKINLLYNGYSGITTEVKVYVKLEKRFLFAFWNDVAEWTDSSSNVNGAFQFTHSVGSGTYRATIEYQIYGSGGATDVITEELEYKY